MTTSTENTRSTNTNNNSFIFPNNTNTHKLTVNEADQRNDDNNQTFSRHRNPIFAVSPKRYILSDNNTSSFGPRRRPTARLRDPRGVLYMQLSSSCGVGERDTDPRIARKSNCR